MTITTAILETIFLIDATDIYYNCYFRFSYNLVLTKKWKMKNKEMTYRKEKRNEGKAHVYLSLYIIYVYTFISSFYRIQNSSDSASFSYFFLTITNKYLSPIDLLTY